VLQDTEDKAEPPPTESKEKDTLFVSKGEEGKPGPRDWIGPARDKRSTFLILRLLMTENTQR